MHKTGNILIRNTGKNVEIQSTKCDKGMMRESKIKGSIVFCTIFKRWYFETTASWMPSVTNIITEIETLKFDVIKIIYDFSNRYITLLI